ncbi:ISL3 family transposase [Streptomyces pilosus]|uniref:ISL3 family transposase n=1 Tax=Streptomyces pilosus TaxID=28893 RepID=UPI0036A48027
MIRPQGGVADSPARGRSRAPAGGVTVPVSRRHGRAVGRRERRGGTHRGPEHHGGRVRLPWLWRLVSADSQLLPAVPADVPSGGRRVVLCLRVRRFLCPAISCGRQTFVEQMPGLTRRYGRRTERLRSTLAAVGLALAGRAGARIARVFGLSVSRSTVLRLVESLPDPEVPAPRVVGVDEYAPRKGRHYGTVLVDVESRRPVDLPPDREASSLAAWLAKRPGVEVVCRDRAPFFAEGATAGAPQAVQVADRWHLWHNLSEAAERCVADHRGCLRALAPDPAQPAPKPEKFEDPSGSPWPRGHRFADRTRANHATVHELLTAGLSRRAIGRQLRMTSRTVKIFADAATPEDLFRGQWQGRPSKLDAFKPYLDDRWNQGCTNAWTVWEEIVPRGYQGSYQHVRAYFREKRTSPNSITARPPSPRVVAGWILRRPETYRRSIIFDSRPSWRTAPNSTPSPLTSGPSPRCSPSAKASGCRSGSTPSDVMIYPTFTPWPQASNVSAMPSWPGSPCLGTPVSSKDTSTGSRCSNARCSAAPASLS